MDKISIHKYIFLGTSLRYLQDSQAGWRIHAHNNGYFIADNIRIFLEELEELNFFVTQRASHLLLEFLEEILSTDEDHVLSQDEAQKLNNIINEIRPTFEAEAKGIYALITSEKRYTMEKLTENISGLFSPSVFEKLSELSIYDFQESGYCIAYERPTAAAFHILRATEDTVKRYYKKYIRGKAAPKTWGQMISELKNKSRGKKPDIVVINQLIHIKDSFRNPTNHPEKVYDIHEVQDLLAICVDITNRMVKAL